MKINTPITMHAARTALNQDDDLREWAETWLKNQERALRQEMSNEDFETHWKFVRPERMHAGAIDAVTAYVERNEEH